MKSQDKKKRLRSKGLKLWYLKFLKPCCELCGDTYCLQGHHYYYRSSSPQLMFSKPNHVTLCRKCHARLHFQDPKLTEKEIVKVRGKIWLNKLDKEKDVPLGSSWKTVEWYETAIKKLQ